MKIAIILSVIALVAAAPDTRNKRQYPLSPVSLSQTTTTLHANPIVPVVQPIVVREFIHDSPMPVTEAPVVQSKSEEPIVQSDMHQANDQPIVQENVHTNSGLNSDVPTNSDSHNDNMNVDTTSSVTPLPFVSSTTPLSNSGLNQDIIIPGMNTFSNIFTRAGAFGELDPHLSVNGQFPSVNGNSFPLVNGQTFTSGSLPNGNMGSILPLNQAGGILPLNQNGGIFPLNQGLLPLTQGILPLTQGLYSFGQSILPNVAPVSPIAYSGVAPIAYRAFPYYANPIVTESHHVLPPRPAARQFPIVTTTTLAPEISQVKDAFPVKGHSTRSGVKGGDMGTRSSFPVKGQHSF